MRPTNLSISRAFFWMCLAGLILAMMAAVIPALLYWQKHPNFAITNTYLSDIGADGGWPQIIFNSLTLIAAPIRLLIIMLLILRLRQFSAGHTLTTLVGILAFVSATGTVIMTAVPSNLDAEVHKLGVPLYFFGVVIMQLLIGIIEYRLKILPRLLPFSSFGLVIVFLIFFILFVLLEQGMVSRNTPIIWEWFCLLASVLWLGIHMIILGNSSGKFMQGDIV